MMKIQRTYIHMYNAALYKEVHLEDWVHLHLFICCCHYKLLTLHVQRNTMPQIPLNKCSLLCEVCRERNSCVKSTLSVLQSKGISVPPCFISSASHLLSGGGRPAVCIGVTQQRGGAGQGVGQEDG